jgi:hypothetical protein
MTARSSIRKKPASTRSKPPELHPMVRRFTVQDLEEVQQFAAERLAILEARHPRKRRETPDEYLDRLALLAAPADEVIEARSFIEGLAAGVACDIDQLFPTPANGVGIKSVSTGRARRN